MNMTFLSKARQLVSNTNDFYNKEFKEYIENQSKVNYQTKTP